MKTKIIFHTFLIIALIGLVFTGCENDDSSENQTKEVTIDGESFVPTDTDVTKYNNKIVIVFAGDDKAITIETNDTIAGTYSISSTISGTSSLQATLTFENDSVTFTGNTGTVEITISKNGTISGTYEATVENDDNEEIEISNGAFSVEEDKIEDNTSYTNYIMVNGKKYLITTAKQDGDTPNHSSLYLLSDTEKPETIVFFETYCPSEESFEGEYPFYPSFDGDKNYTFESISVITGADWDKQTAELDLEEGGCYGKENPESDGYLSIKKVGNEYEITFNFKFGEGNYSSSGYYKGNIKCCWGN